MSRLVVNDLFDDLRQENTRLANQLSFANECLVLLNEFRNRLADFNHNCNCIQNNENKSKCTELDNRYKKLRQKSVINSEHNYSFVSDLTNKPNNKKIANKTASNVSLATTLNKKFVVIRAKQPKPVTNAPKTALKTYTKATAVKIKEKESSLRIEDLDLSAECVKNLLNEVNKNKQTNKTPENDSEIFKCDQTNCLATFHKLPYLKRHKFVAHQQKATEMALNFEAVDKRATIAHNKSKPNDEYGFEALVDQSIVSKPKNFVEYKFEALDKQTKVIKFEVSDSDNNLFRCFQCDFSHKSETVFNRHYDNVHKLHKCPYCDKQFRKYGYKAHIRNIHVRRMCVCDKCGKTFSRKNFLRHSRIHGENTYKCDFNGCTYSTNNSTNLRSHKLIHKPKPIQCDFPGCKRLFSMNSQLNSHYKVVHGNHKRYECTWPECNARFKYTASLAIHVRSKHTGEKPFDCDWPDCGSKFGSKSQLQFHYKVVHLKLKKFVCDWPGCSKTFSLSCNLHTHMRVHLNQRIYKCDYPQCEKSYYSSDKLKRHKKVHT